MKRYEDWPQRLVAAIEAARGRPFAWGAMDCCLFAADVVLAMTGVDYAAGFRGRYDSRAGAVALLGARGGLEAVATSALGEPLPTTLMAQRGDVVMVRSPEGPALGVCEGVMAWFAGPDGVVPRPMREAVKAWRV
jgi:hypothetical protein